MRNRMPHGAVFTQLLYAQLRTKFLFLKDLRLFRMLAGALLVRVAGLEPALREERVFETLASTIPPHPHGAWFRWRAKGRQAWNWGPQKLGRPLALHPPARPVRSASGSQPRASRSRRAPEPARRCASPKRPMPMHMGRPAPLASCQGLTRFPGRGLSRQLAETRA